MSNILRMTIDKLFFKKVPFLKLSAAFPTSILGETASTMSWNNQMFVEESRDLVSGIANIPKVLKDPNLLCLDHST